MKLVGWSTPLLLVTLMGQSVHAEMLFNRGLPVRNVNQYKDGLPSPERSNIRWGGGGENDRFYGDDFRIGNPGERYRINHIRTWVALGYRDGAPVEPEHIGDWFSQVRLFGGAPASESNLTLLVTGEVGVGRNESSNADIVISKASYPDGRPVYENFGHGITLWQIDFFNLDWVVEGGRRYNFSVQGIGRPRTDTDYAHTWYNHASNAGLSGSFQESADDLMLLFSHEGEFLQVAEGDAYWDKPSDINIQIFGEALDVESATHDNPSETSAIVLPRIVQELGEIGLLAERAYQRSLIEAEQGTLERRSHLLQQLADESYRRFLDENNISQRAGVQLGFETPSDEYLAEFQQSLERLNQTGVLSSRVYRQLQADITVGQVGFLADLYRRAADLMRLYEALEADRVRPHLARLQEAGILSAAARADLLTALEAERLNDPIEFLEFSDQAILFDLRDYSDNPEEYFPAIHGAIAAMLLEQGMIENPFGDFELALKQRELWQSTAELEALAAARGLNIEAFFHYDAVVSVEANGRYYKHASFYSPPNSEQDFLGKLESSEFIHLFNKILRDQASPYRLYTVGSSYAGFTGSFGPPIPPYAWFGVVALTQEQANVYFGQNHTRDHDPLPELTSDRIQAILVLFEQIGLLEHLSDEQIAAGRDLIAESYITHPYELLSAFENVLLTFDWESGNIDNPYQALTQEFAAISRGYFSPTNITNEFDWNTQTAGQTFTLNGKEHSVSLEFQGDWLDPQFFEFIQSVVAQEIPQGNFYAAYDDYGTLGYFFLTKTQLEALEAEALLQFDSYDSNHVDNILFGSRTD